MMSYEPTVRTKPVFSYFLACRDERKPYNKISSSSSSSSTGSCASRDDTKDLASISSEDYRDRQCIAAPLLERSAFFFGPTLLFLARQMLCWQLALFLSVFPSRRLRLKFHLFTYSLLTTGLCISRIRRKALNYTAVYRLGESSLPLKCAVRGAHRSALVVVHAACLCCWLFPFCCCLNYYFSTATCFPS